jgi:MFS family permease
VSELLFIVFGDTILIPLAGMTACSTWFLRHRALAIGIMASGSSVGGIVLPIMVRRLIVTVGFGWAMRSVAFLLLGMVAIGILTVKSRLPPLKQPLGVKDFISPYKEPTFLLLAVATWFIYMGGFLPFTFIIVQAKAQGMSASLAGYLVSILNAASTFGRIVPAHFGDVFGVFNIMILLTGFGAIVNFALWLPSTVMESGHTNALIIVYTIFYGFASGCIFSIIPAMIAKISPDMRKLGVRTGSLYAVSATGVLIGSPIAGVIAAGDGNGFLGLTVFSGALLMVGTGFVVLSRVKLTGWKLLVKA